MILVFLGLVAAGALVTYLFPKFCDWIIANPNKFTVVSVALWLVMAFFLARAVAERYF